MGQALQFIAMDSDDGDPVSYGITGSSGMYGWLAAAIKSIEGQAVGFLVHNNVVARGSNAADTIAQVRFGRVRDVRSGSPPHHRC